MHSVQRNNLLVRMSHRHDDQSAAVEIEEAANPDPAQDGRWQTTVKVE